MRIRGFKSHKRYWKNRQINWVESYLNPEHPHRLVIAKKLLNFKPVGSVFEIGCGAGANLYLIRSLDRNVEVAGIDINEDAIKTAREAMLKLGQDNPEFFEAGSYDNIFAGDGSSDVILSDMSLIYANKRTALKTLRHAKRIARKGIILCEFHSESFWKRIGVWLATGYFAYNYKKLLEDAGFYDIEITPLTPEDWPETEKENGLRCIVKAVV